MVNNILYKKSINKKRKGYTIIEILIGVMVSLIVAAGIFAGWNSFFGSHQSENMAQQVFQIIQNVRQSYAKSPSGYSNITNDMGSLIQEKVFPDTLVIDKSAGTVKNNFGGSVTLEPDTTTGGFTLTFKNVPSDTCMNYLKSTGGTGLYSIDVGGAVLWTTGDAWPEKSKIAEACGNGTGAKDMAFHAN